MAGAIISPSLPSMYHQFSDVRGAEYLVRLVLTVPAFFIALCSPVAGFIVDRFGRKQVLILGLLLYGIAGSSAAFLESIYHILVTRVFLGVAVAAIMTTITTLIADYYEGRTRARFIGLQAASIGIGGMVYLTSGGLLAEIAWNAPFLIYLTALVLVPVTISSIFEPKVLKQKSFNPVKISEGDRSILRKSLPLMVFICALMFFVHIMFYLIPTQLPFHLRDLTGATGVKIGIAIATSTFFSAIASYMYGRISSYASYITIIQISLGLIGIGYVILGVSTLYIHILIGLFFSGVGVGLFMPNVTMWLSVVAPASYRGRALGALTTSIFLGHFSSVVVMQPFISRFGFSDTFIFIAVIIGVLISLLMIFSRWNFLRLRDVS